MNKTLLIIICDFLLISILALVEFKPEVEVEEVDEQVLKEQAADEMLELLQLSLEHEAAQREEVESSLDATREELEERQQALEQVSSTLEEREAEKAALENRSRNLESTLSNTRESLEEARGNLEQTIGQLELTRQEREQLARDLEEREQRARQLQEELQAQQALADQKNAALEDARETLAQIEREQAEMATQLQIRETEKEMLRQNLVAARAEVERARLEAERAQRQTDDLAAGVSELAATSTALKEEIRQAQPLSLNAIYKQFEDNRVLLRFSWTERAFLSTTQRQSALQSLLVDTGETIHAVFAAANTPLAVMDDREPPSAVMRIGDRSFAVKEVSFLDADRGIAAVRVPDSIAQESGLKVFSLSQDPFRFSDAVLVKDDQELYGEIPVRVPPGESGVLEVENRLFNRLFGEFSPDAGDYVFSMTGELIGIMTEGSRARMLRDPVFSGNQDLPMP